MAFFNVQNGDAMLRPLGAPEKQEHSAKPSGQWSTASMATLAS
jgi:hypothetical protein